MPASSSSGRSSPQRPSDSFSPADPSLGDLLDAVERLARSENAFHEVDLRVGNTRLRVSRGPAGAPGVAVASGGGSGAVVPTDSREPDRTAGTEAPGPGLDTVTSPMVGTFYRRPRPEAQPFVESGDRVEKGQILCIIEAMKLMNNIEAESAGEIVEVVAGDGAPVQFGDPLFVMRPD